MFQGSFEPLFKVETTLEPTKLDLRFPTLGISLLLTFAHGYIFAGVPSRNIKHHYLGTFQGLDPGKSGVSAHAQVST